MVCNIFFNIKLQKWIISQIISQISEKCMGVLKYQCTVFIVFKLEKKLG